MRVERKTAPQPAERAELRRLLLGGLLTGCGLTEEVNFDTVGLRRIGLRLAASELRFSGLPPELRRECASLPPGGP